MDGGVRRREKGSIRIYVPFRGRGGFKVACYTVSSTVRGRPPTGSFLWEERHRSRMRPAEHARAKQWKNDERDGAGMERNGLVHEAAGRNE